VTGTCGPPAVSSAPAKGAKRVLRPAPPNRYVPLRPSRGRGRPPIDPTLVALALLTGSVAAGYIGSLLGLGGGFLLVPLMTVALGVDIRVAVAVSIVAVVATSTGSGAASVRRGVTNTRLAMFLEVGTTLGAIAGAFVALSIERGVLVAFFGVALLSAVPFMLRPFRPPAEGNGEGQTLDRVLAPSRLRLAGHFEDATGAMRAYGLHRPASGFSLSAFAGVLSGMLGIGGGIVKVPAMRAVMGAPIQVAIGTSNFMIGVTAAAGALVYFSEGSVDLVLASTAVVGVFVGTRYGTRRAESARADVLGKAFAAVLVAMAATMFLKAAGAIA